MPRCLTFAAFSLEVKITGDPTVVEIHKSLIWVTFRMTNFRITCTNTIVEGTRPVAKSFTPSQGTQTVGMRERRRTSSSKGSMAMRRDHETSQSITTFVSTDIHCCGASDFRASATESLTSKSLG